MKNKYFLTFILAIASTALIAQTTVWTAEGEPAKWNEPTNWTGADGVYPDFTVKTVFNVPTAADCLVDVDSAEVLHLVMGDNNPNGGVLTIQDGGVLTTSEDGPWSTVGYNNSAEMLIEAGGEVISNHRFHVGLVGIDAPAEAILEVAGKLNVQVNKFTVNDPGDANWTAEVYVTTGGEIVTPGFFIGEGGLVDVSGGMITMDGDMVETLGTYVNAGQLTAEGGSEEPTIELVIVGEDTTTTVKSSTTVGFENRIAKTALGIYPNPATDVVYFKENVVANVQVYSITGEIVLRRDNVSQVNIETLKPGYYILKAEADNKTFVDKLLVR